MSLSAVQAGDITLKMATHMGAAGHGACNKCGADGAKLSSCALACTVPVLTAFLQAVVLPLVPSLVPTLPQDALARGRMPAPDPHPPKSIDRA